MKFSRISFILLASVLVAGLVLPASAETIFITPSSASVLPGSSTTFLISLDSAPEGISGYVFRISLSNPAVAEITGVTYPSWVTINETIGVPSDSVTITGIDLGEVVLAGATNVPFGSVTVRGDNVGSSNLVLDVQKLDTHEGNRLTLTVTPVPIIVKSSSSGGGGGGGGGGGSEYTSTSAPTTVTTTVATTQPTSVPTTVVQETVPSDVQTGDNGLSAQTQEPTSAVPKETTPAPALPAESDAGDLPFHIPWIAVIVVLAIMVVAAISVLYLAITKRI
jgi:hypothetical protein